ncbi:transcription intermediary factor 1-alpha-like isoform X10 [Mytilus edulis]|uniref:transcription intermediary factor 1-alpha-like isoform X10 n=1 Tax=Mytilus edulis TaxID=6550 RepID=UPI0039EFAE4B
MNINQNAFLLCPICEKEYDDRRGAPRVLPCLHTCCSTCLQDLLNDNELCCQQCQTRFDKTFDGVEAFPLDTAIRNYLDFIRVQLRPTEVPCTDCPDEANAHAFCRDCFLFICHECTRAHKRTHVTKKHILVSIEDMRECDLRDFHRKDTCQTKGHEEQIFTFYCDKRGCDVPICTLCAVSDHNQQHGHIIRNLSEVYEDSKSTVHNVIREINNRGNPMSEAVSQFESVVDDLTEKESEINHEIDSIFDRFQKLLEERRERLHREVEHHCQSRKRELTEKVSELKSYSTNVKTAVEFATRVMSYTTASEFLVLRDVLLKRILELKNHKVSIPAKDDVALRFYRGASDESFADLVNAIGKIVTKDSSNSPETVNSSFQSESYRNSKRSSLSDFQIELQKDFNTLNSLNNSPSLNEQQGSKSDYRMQKTSYQSTKQSMSNGPQLIKPNSRSDDYDTIKPSIQTQYYTPKQSKQSEYRYPAENESGVVQVEFNGQSLESRDIQTPDSEFETARSELRDVAKSMNESKFKPIVNGTTEAASPSQDKPSFFSRHLSSPPENLHVISSETTERDILADDTESESIVHQAGLTDCLQSLENKGELPRLIFPERSLSARSKEESPPVEETSSVQITEKAFISPRAHRPPSQDQSEDIGVFVRNGIADGQPRSGPAIFNDVTSPDFSFDVLTVHEEREVSIDGKTLRNRKTGNPSSSTVVGPNQLKQYKGIIGNYSFQQPGKYYYEVDVTFNIIQPLEQTWLVFELGLSRKEDIDKHHTVERHEFARSFYVARYPEDGKLSQEFWHNRDLKAIIPLCDNSPGLTVEMTYGILINTATGKITIADVKREKKLYTFTDVDFSKPLFPVFGTYNSDLVNVIMRIRAGASLVQFPPFLKGNEALDSPRKSDPFDSDQRIPAENEKGMIQRQISMPTRMAGGQHNMLSPRNNMSRSSENINETSFDSARSGLRTTTAKPVKSKFGSVTNGNCSPKEKPPQSFFNRTRSQRSLSQTGEKSFQPTSERSFKPITSPLNQRRSYDTDTDDDEVFAKSSSSEEVKSGPATFNDVQCPDFALDVDTCHEEREASVDGKIFKNRKTGKPSSGNPKKQLQQYKGILGNFSFKEPGKYYFEVVVTFNIIQPLEQTWLVFEIGLCRREDVDKHHTVERHEHARSFYVARYPEDGKLAQEFWHNRDLLAYVPLSENKAGLNVEVTYGMVVDTKRKKWIIADVKKEKKLHTFSGLNFTKPLLPVFGAYNPDLISVEMKVKTGAQISSYPAFLKGL